MADEAFLDKHGIDHPWSALKPDTTDAQIDQIWSDFLSVDYEKDGEWQAETKHITDEVLKKVEVDPKAGREEAKRDREARKAREAIAANNAILHTVRSPHTTEGDASSGKCRSCQACIIA